MVLQNYFEQHCTCMKKSSLYVKRASMNNIYDFACQKNGKRIKKNKSQFSSEDQSESMINACILGWHV